MGTPRRSRSPAASWRHMSHVSTGYPWSIHFVQARADQAVLLVTESSSREGGKSRSYMHWPGRPARDMISCSQLLFIRILIHRAQGTTPW